MGIQAEGFLLPSILKGNNSIISGNTTFTVRPMFASNVPWDSGNLTPANYAALSGAAFTNTVSMPSLTVNGTISAAGNIQVGNAVSSGLYGDGSAMLAVKAYGNGTVYIQSQAGASYATFNPTLATVYANTQINGTLSVVGGQIQTDIMGNGGLRLLNGGNYTGFIEFRGANTSVARLGYIGFGLGNTVSIQGETAAWTFGGLTPVFTNGISVSAGNTSMVNSTVSGTLTVSSSLILPSGAGSSLFGGGTGDGASYTVYNTKLQIWNGLGLASFDGTINAYYDSRNGVWDTKGVPKVNGQQVWYPGNFNPATKLNVGSGITLPAAAGEVHAWEMNYYNANNAYNQVYQYITANGASVGVYDILQGSIWNTNAGSTDFILKGNKAWTTANFNPSLYAPLAAPTFTGAITISGSTNITGTNKLSFQAANLGQKIDLWGGTYGFGMQNSTMYARTNGDFTIFSNGVHSDTQGDPGTGGTLMMRMNAGLTTINTPVTITGGLNNTALLLKRDDAQLVLSATANTNNAWGMNSFADGNLYIQQYNANGFVSNAAWMDRTNSFTFTNNVVVAGRLTGAILSANNNAGAIGVAAGGQSVLEVRTNGNANSAAFMQFHRAGFYAAYLGLDTDNQFKVGGWSMGAVAYRLWHEGNMNIVPQGQCRFVRTSNTVCTLMPYNGNQLFINGANYSIPYGGVTLSNAGLSNLLYYVYASVGTGNTIVLSASTTTHGASGSWGNEVMQGDATKSLVGMIVPDQNGIFRDESAFRLVATYFNRRHVDCRSVWGTGATAATSGWTPIGFNVYFLNWADTAVSYWWTGWNTDGYTGGHTNYTNLYIDGVNQTGDYMTHSIPNAYAANHTTVTKATLAEGTHSGSLAGYGNSGSTVTWYGQFHVSLMI